MSFNGEGQDTHFAWIGKLFSHPRKISLMEGGAVYNKTDLRLTHSSLSVGFLFPFCHFSPSLMMMMSHAFISSFQMTSATFPFPGFRGGCVVVVVGYQHACPLETALKKKKSGFNH